LQFASVSDPDLLLAPDPPATNVETTAKAATARMATAPGVAAAAASTALLLPLPSLLHNRSSHI
jgi:hypothetical protein